MSRRPLTLILSLLIVAIIAAGAAAYCFTRRTANVQPIRVNLPLGTTTAQMADSLAAADAVQSRLPFDLFYKLYSRSGRRVLAGSYLVQPHERVLFLARQIARGQQTPIRLTIGRIRTPEQFNALMIRQLEADTFAFDSSTFHLVHPDTYELYWTIAPDELLARMKREDDRFWQRRGVDSTATCCGIALTRREISVLASIVEEETNAANEKPLIASVYLNRLRRGMLLQADPTVKYAVGDFTLRRILNVHLSTESPYNTYLHAGLPPSPICLPSAQSIDAVLHAPQTSYLYFCASDRMDGTHRFATTLAEHNRNAAAFHAALNQRRILR